MKYLLLLAMLLSYSAFAAEKEPGGGSVVGNGGDTLALEFAGALDAALAHVQSSARKEYADLRGIILAERLPQLKIVTVDTPLESRLGSITQESLAVNFPENQLVLFNRTRWLAIQAPHLKEGLALHEALSLLGKEGTGNYRYSGTYLAEFGIQPGEVERKFSYVKEAKSYQTKDGLVEMEAVAQLIPKDHFFDDYAISYAVKLNGRVIDSYSRLPNEMMVCMYGEREDPRTVPHNFLRLAEADGKPFGFLLTGLGICGNTTSYRSRLVVPRDKHYYAEEFVHKTMPVMRLKNGEPEIWYLTQVWGNCGTAGSFFVPNVLTIPKDGWITRGKFPEFSDIPKFGRFTYDPYPTYYLAGLRAGSRPLMDLAADYASKDAEAVERYKWCGLPDSAEAAREHAAAIEKLAQPLSLFYNDRY